MKNTILCILVAAGAYTSLPADEGRIPLFRPTTITQPGHYVLTRDIQGTSGPVIDIGASDVTIDLNGHLISSTDPASSLIEVVNVQKAVVSIRNGRLSGGSVAIFSAQPAVRLSVEKVEIENSARAIYADGAQSVRVVGCRVIGATSDPSIFIRGGSGIPAVGEVADNLISGVGGGGLGLVNFRAGIVRGNVIENFGTTASFTYGIDLEASGTTSNTLGGNLIDSNIVRSSNDDVGIAIGAGPNNLLTNNTITGLGQTGIVVQTSGNRFSGNVISSNSGSGVSIRCNAGCIGDHNVLERNTVTQNGISGVSIDGNSTLIDDNLIEGNTGYGISFSSGTGNTYRANMLRDNTSGAVNGVGVDAGGNIF